MEWDLEIESVFVPYMESERYWCLQPAAPKGGYADMDTEEILKAVEWVKSNPYRCISLDNREKPRKILYWLDLIADLIFSE